jgi:opacity protein-like surface antigen
MRSIFKAILVLLLIVPLFGSAALLAAGQEQAQAPEPKAGQARFKLGGYYEGWMLNDKNLTSFFGHSQKNVGGFEASVYTVYNIDVWFSYRTYSDETKTPVFQNTDKFGMNAVSLGLIYRPIVWKMIEPFIGAGAEFYSYSETIEGQTELLPTHGNAAGMHFQFGTYINITKFLAGKLFFRLNSVNETLTEPLPDGTTKLDLGGKEFGVSLLFRFL